MTKKTQADTTNENKAASETKTCKVKTMLNKATNKVKEKLDKCSKTQKIVLAVIAIFVLFVMLFSTETKQVSYEYLNSARGYVKEIRVGNDISRKICQYRKTDGDNVYYSCKNIKEM